MKLSEWKNTFNLNQMNFTSTHLEEVTDEPGTKLVQSRPFMLLVFTSYTHGDIIKLEPDWCRTFKIPVFCDLKSQPIFFFFQTHIFVCSYLFTPLCRLCSERLVVFLASALCSFSTQYQHSYHIWWVFLLLYFTDVILVQFCCWNSDYIP